MSEDPLDRLDPLSRLELERLQQRAVAYRERKRGGVYRDGDADASETAASSEPLSPEERIESFVAAALVHLEPDLDEEHAIRAQLAALREAYIADVAKGPEDEVAWIEALTDDVLDVLAETFARDWPMGPP